MRQVIGLALRNQSVEDFLQNDVFGDRDGSVCVSRRVLDRLRIC